MITSRLLLALAVSLGSLAPPLNATVQAAVQASPRKASRLAQQAEELWQDEAFAEASSLLGRAYELDPKPAYLYARASVERDAGNCEQAVALFDEFLATEPPEDDRAAAETAMKPCQEKLAAAAAEAEAAAKAVAEAERLAAEKERLAELERREAELAKAEAERKEREARENPPPPPARKDVLAAILVGVGGGAFLGGMGTMVAGLVIHKNAVDAPNADEFVAGRERGRLLTGVGIGVAAAGLAVAAGGALRYGLLARKRKQHGADAAVRITPAPGGLALRF